ncbi:MAG: M20/M25/M40 family metallo-hydrolase, partial [Myxococcota bacterium]
MPRTWRQHLDAHKKGSIETLKELLRIPSISADPAHRDDCKRAAEWVLARLEGAGFDGRLETVEEGQPIVAARRIEDEDKPTVTLYGHYDVQPADPLDLWTTPPFEPTVEKGIIRARGATDDKGQVVANLVALEALAATDAFPCNVQVLIEGEEESGGVTLASLLAREPERTRADAVLVADSAFFAPGWPAVYT